MDELEYMDLSKFDSSINRKYNNRLKNELNEEIDKNLKLAKELNKTR